MTSSQPSGSRRPDIQGLRAIAVLQVVAFHAGLPAPGGFVGVDVFFVISGFVITAMLLREWRSTGDIRFARFYARRFKRLTPALALMATVTVLGSAILLSPIMRQQAAAQTAIGAMLLAANRVIALITGGYFGAQAETNPLLHTWSLSVEEQFYLAFPLMLWVGWRLARRTSSGFVPLVIVAIVTLMSFSAAIVGSQNETSGNASWLIGFYGPLSRAWEFGAGALLALMSGRLAITSRVARTTFATAGLAGVLGSLWVVKGDVAFLPVWTLLPVAGTLLLLVSGSDATTPLKRLLGSQAFVRIGDWSYSIYLWHWPLIVFASVIWPGHRAVLFAAAVLSFAPAIGSYYWVEQPIRKNVSSGWQRFASLVVVTVLPTIVIAAGVGIAARNGWWNPVVRTAVAEMTAEHIPADSRCFTTGPFTTSLIDSCVWNASATGLPLYLVGDSDAWQFVEGVIAAGAMLNRPVHAFASPSCTYIWQLRTISVRKSVFSPRGPPSTREYDHCPAYVDFTLRNIKSAPHGVVIISGLDQRWWDPAIGVGLAGKSIKTDEREKVDVFEKGLIATITQLHTAGHRVILVQSIPTFRNPAPAWDPTTCSVLTLLRDNCARTIPFTFVDSLQRPSRDAVLHAAAATGAIVLDLRDVFCRTQVCSTGSKGVSLYHDAIHLTPTVSRALAPRFANIIIAASLPSGSAGRDTPVNRDDSFPFLFQSAPTLPASSKVEHVRHLDAAAQTAKP